jgi:hypothetical protein
MHQEWAETEFLKAIADKARAKLARALALTSPGSTGEEYNAKELRWLKAISGYKRRQRRPFPSWIEVLSVIDSLGYIEVGADEEGTEKHVALLAAFVGNGGTMPDVGELKEAIRWALRKLRLNAVEE